MENRKIVFSDKKEAKFLMIVGVLMALALFLLIIISDIIRKNEHLLHNLFRCEYLVGLLGWYVVEDILGLPFVEIIG